MNNTNTQHQHRRRGRELLRVSFDRSGREKSHGEQHGENKPAAARHGITLGKPYSETGSASRYARKKRDDFPRMLDELRSGKFDAEVLILWESSRGSRKVGEWCVLIDTCEEAGVLIFVTTHDRIYDCSNARDRRSLQEDAVDSEYESAKTSQRVTRDHAAAAKAGRPAGPCPFGYLRVVDPLTRELSQVKHPTEADVFVSCVEDYLAERRTMSQIARDIGRTLPSVRKMLANPTYCGVRVHKGDEYPASWPALITKAQHRALVRKIAKGETGPRATPQRRYPYTGLLLCSECERKLSCRKANNTDRFRRYVCSTATCRRIASRADELDDFFEARLDEFILEAVGLVGDPNDDSPGLAQLRQRLVELDERAEQELAEYNAEELTMAEYKSMKASTTKLRDEVQAKIEAQSEGFDASDLLDADGRPFTMADLDDDQKRALAARLVERVVVRPSGRHTTADWTKLLTIHRR
jgi:DNA invertase Pin-like site-specific DNA recombinase